MYSQEIAISIFSTKSDDYVSFIRTIAKAPRRKLMSEGSSTRLGGGMGGGL